MKTEQVVWDGMERDKITHLAEMDGRDSLVIIFGRLTEQAVPLLKEFLPKSHIIGCTTAGEISNEGVSDGLLIVTVIQFEQTSIKKSARYLSDYQGACKALGVALATDLLSPELRHVFVLSDGLQVDGTYLVEGFRNVLPENVKVTGGLAGDCVNFQKTEIYTDNVQTSGLVVAIGLYGDALQVSYGSRGGWCSFGIERKVTHSEGNVLYELDDESALEIYRSYLGELTKELPSSGLRFPLEISDPNRGTKLVRTLLATDDEKGSISFAGNIPDGVTAKLMRANVDSLIDGAQDAAKVCRDFIDDSPQIAILISCVGRKLLLKQLADDEVDAVREELGPDTLLCGFYSYGEIAPYDNQHDSELHNQTMTITAFSEK
ncbi:FIST signal transduction protein [Vibrio atypicus]|uniref:FIST signal transduction protein n=1 Tax=Vibrio atypicus TaxID=558271 RepID=UPI001359A856|nr:FIST N-terminal domain-containing protein [Vibrio atypicus]